MDINQFGIAIYEMMIGKFEEKMEVYEVPATS
jgi:hypothetical protein